MATACGFSATSGFKSCSPSVISTVMTFDCRIVGSLAQPSTFTTLAAKGPPSCAASARGTTNSAKSTTTATLRRGWPIAARFSVRIRYRSISSRAEPGSRRSDRGLTTVTCMRWGTSSAGLLERTRIPNARRDGLTLTSRSPARERVEGV